MFPLNWRFVDVSTSYSSSRFALEMTTRTSSGWVPSISIRLVMNCSGAGAAGRWASRRRNRPCCGRGHERRRRKPDVRTGVRPTAVDSAAEISACLGPGRHFLQNPTSACSTGFRRVHCRHGIAVACRVRVRSMPVAPRNIIARRRALNRYPWKVSPACAEPADSARLTRPSRRRKIALHSRPRGR